MEKIVAFKNNRGIQLGKISTDTESDNFLRMRMFVSGGGTVNSYNAILNFANKFNQIVWDVKKERVFPRIDELEGEDREDYIREAIENCFINEINEIDLPYLEVYGVDNLQRNFRSEDFTKLRQIECFDRMPIPDKTKEFLNSYIETVESVQFTESQLKNIYTQFSEPVQEVEEYVIYVGENSKYKGCVGKIIDNREDVAPNLIQFDNINGKTFKYWSKEDNLVRFYI